MQLDRLNQGEWAELEAQVRKWSKQYGDIDVKIELVFAVTIKYEIQECIFLQVFGNTLPFQMIPKNVSISPMRMQSTIGIDTSKTVPR